MARAKPYSNSQGEQVGYTIHCPACDCRHALPVYRPHREGGPTWKFDGNIQRPTFTPSLLLYEPGWVGIPVERWMPLHRVEEEVRDDDVKVGHRIPFAILDEATAHSNHRQTLATLRERGGMTWREFADLVEKTRDIHRDREAAKALVLAHAKKHLDSLPRIVICHSFIRDDSIEYLSDCRHAMKGQTVDLPEID